MEVDISGAKVFFTIPIDFPLFGKIQISETLVVSWIVMALITGLCIWLTRDLKIRNISKRQAVAEMIVETANKFVIVNALRKFESAGVIESRSSGMKGTYIKVLNDYIFDELDEIKARKNLKGKGDAHPDEAKK